MADAVVPLNHAYAEIKARMIGSIGGPDWSHATRSVNHRATNEPGGYRRQIYARFERGS